MKTTTFTVFYLLVCTSLSAQTGILERQKENAKNKVNSRIENKIDRGIDKTLDKIEEIGQKEKEEKQRKQDSISANQSHGNSSGTNSTTDAPGNSNADSKSLKSYSKFDYVAGEKILVNDQFETTEIGDFPMNWNTNATAEVVRFDGVESKFLKLGTAGIYKNEDILEIPENFTLDFNVFFSENYSEMMSGIKICFTQKMENPMMFDQNFGTDPQVGMDIHPTNSGGTCSFWVFDPKSNQTISNEVTISSVPGEFLKISIWRQKTRIRVYVNETKVMDLPRAFFPELTYELLFANHTFEGDLFLGDIRFAVGAPDTRSRLITEGKLVTRGIQFDVNAANLKPESYGVLKEIATVLNENPTVRIKIIGHTDSDGDEKANLTLSKKRAESVKKSLIDEFKISSDRIQTDGKGESEPSDPNTTSVGKANNRRVEFIKL